jgi:hypothetical protein
MRRSVKEPVGVDLRHMVLDAKEAEVYDRYFSVMFADTPQLLDQVYRLRYEVYCVEHSFEPEFRN